jgi:hypothetical protein
LQEQVTFLARELAEARQQQTATSEVLQTISNSPAKLQPVIDAMLEKATRICGAHFGVLHLCEGDAFPHPWPCTIPRRPTLSTSGAIL